MQNVTVAYEPDPASLMLEGGARRLLARAYAQPGKEQMTRLADPNLRTRQRLSALGIDPDGPDDASVQGGRGLDARSRWMRAFIRALYREHRTSGGRHTGSLRIEVGRRVPATGVILAGRAVRITYDKGGRTALRAVQRKPDRSRIYDDRGEPAARWSDPALRDWA